MHNNIMAAGSKDRPPMLGPGRYSQWRSQAIFLLLTGIGDDIYSTVDACKTANEMWIAIERLQQGESLNVQDVKTNLFWEFGKFTSRDGESMESYYSRFYKLMNELTRNNLQVTTMQVNVQFLQQLQPEWSRFVTVVKQSKEIDTISYHTLFDILKQYQNDLMISVLKNGQNQYSSEDGSDPEQKLRGIEDNAKEIGHSLQRADWESKENTVAGASETVESQVVQQNGYSALNCKELEECKTNLDETSRALGEATSYRDSCLIALQNKQNELEKYIAFNDRTIDYDILQTKLNETLGLLARKDIDIKEALLTLDAQSTLRAIRIFGNFCGEIPGLFPIRVVVSYAYCSLSGPYLLEYHEEQSEIIAQSEEAPALLVEKTMFLTLITSHEHEGFPDFIGSLEQVADPLELQEQEELAAL
ncbi:hypothetical protein Tco_0032175 [Tanacetum coccineum]